MKVELEEPKMPQERPCDCGEHMQLVYNHDTQTDIEFYDWECRGECGRHIPYKRKETKWFSEKEILELIDKLNRHPGKSVFSNRNWAIILKKELIK